MGCDGYEMKIIVDNNVGRLAKWLRMMGFDTITFDSADDSVMVSTALAQGRIILTRDTQIIKRRLVTSGRLKAILIRSENPEQQIREVMDSLKLRGELRPFTICLECNTPLVERSKQEIEGRVPPYVYQTQNDFMECPSCHRIYWKGTHWQAMTRKLEKLSAD